MMEIKMHNHGVALIDDAAAGLVTPHKWRMYNFGGGLCYATALLNRKTVFMHRLIVGAKLGEYVDHIDRDGMNNQQSNLRITSQSNNIANAGMFSHNTSGYRGVIQFRGSWRAQIKYKKKVFQSPNLADVIQAALLRDELARILFGEITYLNFPDQQASESIKLEAIRIVTKRKKYLESH